MLHVDMSSRAKGYKSRKRRRSYGQANKDRRTKALEVYRLVDRKDSERIEAAMTMLFGPETEVEDLPELSRIQKKHRMTILDPLLVKAKFGRGFEAGYNFREAMEEIKEECDGNEEHVLAMRGVSIVGFKGRRRLITLDFYDERIRKEQEAVRKCLGDVGMRGFKGKEAKTLQPTRLVIAQARLHIPSDAELTELAIKGRSPDPYPMSEHELVDNIEQVLVDHGITEVGLGPAVVKAA